MSADDEDDVAAEAELRDVMVRRLLEQRTASGSFPTGAVQRVADICGVHRSAVYRWCKRGSSRRQRRARWSLDDVTRAAIIEANGYVAGSYELLQDRGAPLKSLATFYRAVRRDPDATLVTYARSGAQGLQSGRVALKTPRQGPNERWEIDHAVLPLEVLLKKGDPRTVRLHITVLIDCDGGDIVGHALSFPAPTRGTVLAVLRQAIERYGIPNVVACDNALTFTARAVRQVAAMLDFRVAPLPPFSPEAKGGVERAIGTIKVKFCARQPFYIEGPRRKDRTLHGIEAARLDAETVSLRLRQFVGEHNTKVKVRHLGGKARAAIRAERSGVIRWAPAEDLRTLTLERTTRVVRKDGGIWIDNVAFFDPALHGNKGRTVRVGMMPGDYSRIEVWLDGKWLCTAAPTRTLTEEERDASRQEKARLNRELGRLRRLANAQRERYAPMTPDQPTPRPIGRWTIEAGTADGTRTKDPLGFGPEIGEVE
jgi:putative transposase